MDNYVKIKSVLNKLLKTSKEKRYELLIKIATMTSNIDLSCIALAFVILFSNVGYAKNSSTNTLEVEVTPEIIEEVATEIKTYITIPEVVEAKMLALEPVIEEVVEKTPEEQIMENYNLTEEEFAIICAVVLSEAKANSYDDAYRVINVIYNRAHSKKWINEIKRVLGRDDGDSLYLQVICPGQFSVYLYGTYKEMLGVKDVPGYQAIIDFLLSEETITDYLCFRSASTQINDEQFEIGGNKYFSLLTDEDRVETLTRTKNYDEVK